MTCTHAPTRRFTWFAYDGTLCIACCDCGEILAGAAEPWRQVTEAGPDQDTIAPTDIICEATTVDGYTLGSAYVESFGPLAYADNPDRLGFDTIAFCGRDPLDTVRLGKRQAIKLLQQLIAIEAKAKAEAKTPALPSTLQPQP